MKQKKTKQRANQNKKKSKTKQNKPSIIIHQFLESFSPEECYFFPLNLWAS